MATFKQQEKLDLALQLGWVSQEEFNKAMINNKYCYRLVGEIMNFAALEFSRVQYSEAKMRLSYELCPELSY